MILIISVPVGSVCSVLFKIFFLFLATNDFSEEGEQQLLEEVKI